MYHEELYNEKIDGTLLKRQCLIQYKAQPKAITLTPFIRPSPSMIKNNKHYSYDNTEDCF